MVYELHIARSSKPMTAAELRDAVPSCRGLRISQCQTSTATNPTTGDVIPIDVPPGSCELFDPDTNAWHPVFRLSNRRLHFAARFDCEDPSHPVRLAAALLAEHLYAEICGDKGSLGLEGAFDDLATSRAARTLHRPLGVRRPEPRSR